MASTATNPDTIVNIKINVEGSNKRFKLPLRDLGATTLPDKLRSLLNVAPTADVVFERYSDSAAAFITLDPSNASVYKQLYRAAKAKLKLRLKATIIEKEPVVPKPASVEDEVPESTSQASEQLESPGYNLPPTPPVLAPTLNVQPTDHKSVAEIQRGLEELLTFRSSAPVNDDLPAFASKEEEKKKKKKQDNEIPVTRGRAIRDRWSGDLLMAAVQRKNAEISNTISSFSVFCNNCNAPIPDAHWHCSTCDDGDYDLCQECISEGITCGGEHWLIKRFIKNGKVTNSTTETLAPRPVSESAKLVKEEETIENKPEEEEEDEQEEEEASRTCNSCISELPENNFVTCTTCEDYDLCLSCHIDMKHGHHPKHAFAPAVEDMYLEPLAQALLAPGRNAGHHAICDGCDKYIYGVRHKCLDCPDWDYCSTCIANSKFIHPRHRFVPIYEPADDINAQLHAHAHQPRHHGIYCDGPLCNTSRKSSRHIIGDRYKCAVCHDVDFCADCEASPSNTHNKTHPLIKFRTPVRNVSVTTMGDHVNGQPMPVMGDRFRATRSKSTETAPVTTTNAATSVQTVADLKPIQIVKTEEKEIKSEHVEPPPTPVAEKDLVATFVRDLVEDGTQMGPNAVFEQTWFLRNDGLSAWPAGCSVKFVGGDNMCAVDPEHPTSVHELVSAAESTTCYAEVAPGQEHGFTVLMRTPCRPGKAISYWRLTSPTGEKFGHKLWCDITVEFPVVETEKKAEPTVPKPREETKEEEKSQMIFPKLDYESPATTVHQSMSTLEVMSEGEVDECYDDENVEIDFGEDSEDGFLTDEEYDILDASDEEFLSEQNKAAKN